MDDKNPNNLEGSNNRGSTTSSALAVVSKNDKSDDLVEENIDSQILSILGLEDIFDFTYEEYYSLLKEKAVQGRMSGSKMTTESVELITDELKRVRGKTGRFRVKKKKIDVNKVFGRKQPVKTGAIVKTTGLTSPVVAQDQGVSDSIVATQTAEITSGFGSILESLIVIRKILENQNKFQKKTTENERKFNEGQKKKEREKKLETKTVDTAKEGSKLKAPVIGFFDAIKRFVKNILLGSVVLGLFKWLKDPSNKQAIDGFTKFLTDNAPLILGGLLAIAALPIAATLLGLTGSVLKGVGILSGALGKLGGALGSILRIPGVAPFLGMTVLAPAAGLAATGAFAKFGAPAITDAAAKLDLGSAAGGDPMVRQAYSKLKEEGKAYKTVQGRGGKMVKMEKSTTEMSAEEKKVWDAARQKEAKARELAVDFSRSNQDLYDLNQKLKDLQKENPANIRGGGSRSQVDINNDIQNVKREIKAKEKEKAAKKKTLYNYLKIDPNKPQVQPQTPKAPGLPASAAQPGTGPAGNQVGSPATRTITPVITSRYGVKRGSKTHGGTDLAVDDGTPLAAVSDGQIIDSGVDPGGWGNFLVFKDNQGINHLYGHIRDGYKKSGSVKKGEVIAKVGMTGRTSGPHLHWESGTGWTGGVLTGKFDPLKMYSSTAPFTFDPSIETRLTQAQIAPSSAATPSIPSPTGGNIAMLPLPLGLGQQQQVQSNSAPLQTPVPSFSSEDPNNMTTLVVKAIYNVVG